MDDMQSRIAARRAEIERQRAAAEAEAKAANEARKAEERAAAERKLADKAREATAHIASTAKDASPASVAGVDAFKKAAADQMLRDAVRKRWTAADMVGAGFFVILGALLLSSHPVWGGLLLILGAAAAIAINDGYKEAVKKEYPDLFGNDATPKKP